MPLSFQKEKTYLFADVLTVPSSLDEVYSGQSFSIEVSLTLPPTADVTVTPQASNLVFEPSSITFSATGKSTTGVFSVTTTSPQEVTIRYALSGPGAAFVSVSPASTPLTVNYGMASLRNCVPSCLPIV